MRSFTGRLAAALALVALLVFAAIGLLLYTGFETRLTRADHDQLRTKSRLVVQLMEESRADGLPDMSVRRVNDMMRGQDDLRLTWRTGPEIDQSVRLGEPYRRLGADGVVRDAIEVELPDGVPAKGSEGASPSAAAASAALPPAPSRALIEFDTLHREERLQRYGTLLLAACLAGVLLTSLLGALAARWVSGNLRRLSAEARAIPIGGRLGTRHVDDELGDLVAAFNAALAKLDVAYRQMEGFGADVAHELRSPLANAINGAQVMLSAPRSADDLRDALASNLEELEKVAGIVNDMLFLARADQGERARSLERVDLGQLLDELLDYCAPVLEEAGVRATREGQASAVCNAALIRRAVANLLTNAIRHAGVTQAVVTTPGVAEPGGMASSVTQPGDDGASADDSNKACPRVIARVDALPGAVRITVFNTGPAIPADVAARMFDRFYRADAARSARGGNGDGHGLGLAIVQAIATMHGGRVWAEGIRPSDDAALGEGTRVGLELPGALAAAQQRPRIL